MQVVIPLAGLGTRLRPHTLLHPKPLLPVAGRPILAHIIDRLRGMPIERIVFITGHLGDQIDAWAARHCPFPWQSIVQRDLRGQAHAVALAREHVDRPLLIIFADTIFDADIEQLPSLTDDGMLFVHRVDDPSRFGVAVIQDGRIVRLVEKPRQYVSDQAIVGIYYVRDPRTLFGAIDRIIERDQQLGGEFYLADALQDMIDRGAHFAVSDTPLWADCGTVDAILETNGTLLARSESVAVPSADGVTIVPPVWIGDGACLERSRIGPNVSLGSAAVVRDSTIADSIVGEGTRIENSHLRRALVGSHCVIVGANGQVNISDTCVVELETR